MPVIGETAAPRLCGPWAGLGADGWAGRAPGCPLPVALACGEGAECAEPGAGAVNPGSDGASTLACGVAGALCVLAVWAGAPSCAWATPTAATEGPAEGAEGVGPDVLKPGGAGTGRTWVGAAGAAGAEEPSPGAEPWPTAPGSGRASAGGRDPGAAVAGAGRRADCAASWRTGPSRGASTPGGGAVAIAPSERTTWWDLAGGASSVSRAVDAPDRTGGAEELASGVPLCGSGGCCERLRPSRSALRRTRSACASSMLEEWLETPIPIAKQRSRPSLLVRPSSRASS